MQCEMLATLQEVGVGSEGDYPHFVIDVYTLFLDFHTHIHLVFRPARGFLHHTLD